MTDNASAETAALAVVPNKPKRLNKRGTTGLRTEARKDKLFRRLERLMGQDTIAALVHSGDDKLVELANYLLDPSFRASSLPRLAERAGVKYAAVLDAFRRYKHDEAMVTAARHLPKVMEDTAIDAQSRREQCWVCPDGSGKVMKRERVPNPEYGSPDHPDVAEFVDVDVERTCANCYGHGWVRISGDPDARKLVLEAVGITGKRGPVVAQQFNYGSLPSPEDDLKVIDQAKETP